LDSKADQATTYTKAEVDTAISNASGVPWASGADPGYHYLDAGPAGLVVRSGTDSALQVLGTDNTGSEGKVLFYKDVDVAGKLVVGGDEVQPLLDISTPDGGVPLISNKNIVKSINSTTDITVTNDGSHSLTLGLSSAFKDSKQDALTDATSTSAQKICLSDNRIRGLKTGSNINFAINTNEASKEDIIIGTNQNLFNIKPLNAFSSDGIFFRDNDGNNIIIANATGTTTNDLLVNGVLMTTGNIAIQPGAELTTNTIRATDTDQITIDDNVKLTGAVSCDGNLQAVNIEATGNLSVLGNLTVTGSMTSPFWCSGVINGSTMSILNSNGRYGFTVVRPSGFPTGVYRITFDTPAPDANYVITMMRMGNGNIKIWDSVPNGGPPTTTRFHAVSFDVNWALKDFVFHFSVYV
jgi:hypothetical protein